MGNAIVLVVPAHNEAETLEHNMHALRAFLDTGLHDYTSTIVIVENGSTDRTWEIANHLTKMLSHTVALRVSTSGKGRALREGFTWGLAHTDGNAMIGFVDADLSTELAALSRMSSVIASGADIAIASRLVAGAHVERSLKRVIASHLISTMLRMVAGTHVHDLPCGCKLFRRDVLNTILTTVKSDHWFFDVELTLRAEARGYVITEVPVTWHDIPGRVSRVHFGVALEYWREAWKLRHDLKRS